MSAHKFNLGHTSDCKGSIHKGNEWIYTHAAPFTQERAKESNCITSGRSDIWNKAIDRKIEER